MEKVSVTLMVPKEGKEVVDAAAAIINHFAEKKPIAEAGLLLPQVMAAVDGYDKISAEMKSDGRDELAGYLVQKVMEALEKKIVPAEESPADGA